MFMDQACNGVEFRPIVAACLLKRYGSQPADASDLPIRPWGKLLPAILSEGQVQSGFVAILVVRQPVFVKLLASLTHEEQTA